MKKLNVFLLGAVLMLALVSCKNTKKNAESGRDAVELSGAGATFPLPYYNVVFENFANLQGDVVAYGGIGSGGGVRNLRDEIVDFAGSDAFLTDKEMAEMAPVIHVPTCMGAVVLAYHLPGVSELKLSGDVVADIFAGKIRRWNDERIRTLNAGVSLPDADIIPVFRSDGSGTTAVFTDYLSKVSEDWKNTYGVGKSVNFPVGQAAKGNPGVAGVISQTANSIGYVGSEYAFAQKIPFATLLNAHGEWVTPTPESISVAASGNLPADTRTSITDASAEGAYPISCFTWMIIYQEQDYAGRSEEQSLATLDLLRYILSDEAQQITAEVHYAPLPKKAVELSLQNLNRVTFGGKSLTHE
ncbi:MAG: phosphate ABC transporter substrate-binding protein PstS [Bacteroides sp.]|nr:phosphate ABC transporter substrate-binding protein PstS [Bacteroides sp.]